MNNPIIYIFINGELGMSPGKVAAQVAHAAICLSTSIALKGFRDSYKRTIIVLEAKDTKQIRNLHEYLRTAGIYSEYYIDEGINEVDAYSVTALAVSPIGQDDEDRRELFADFPLYPAKNRQRRFWHL